MAALPYTLALLIPAILLSWWSGNKAGAIAARRKRLDDTVLPISYILTATPYMWLAIMLAWIFASVLGCSRSPAATATRWSPTLSVDVHRGPRLRTGSCRSCRSSS